MLGGSIPTAVGFGKEQNYRHFFCVAVIDKRQMSYRNRDACHIEIYLKTNTILVIVYTISQR